ncbi:MAG: DNA methyltransferase [Helicobacter sp.]|nr:DNA methyltransferase [Helicobacteraceae bacterium]MDY3114075.1 DNA methyltransferase [Helicobacter sp.]
MDKINTLEQKDINYALFETKRPEIYTAMKYWGKKPHNIWCEYIKNYVSKDGVMLDPFCGSGMSGIEALSEGKRAICFDINPLSSFLFEIYTSPFDFIAYKKEVNKILELISNNELYKKLYCYDGLIHNVKSENGVIYEVCRVDNIEGKNRSVEKITNDSLHKEAINFIENLNLQNLGLNFIDEPFLDSDSFSANFIKNIGGNNFKHIWTKRNLVVLSLIFKEILEVENELIKKQLLFAFLMSTHLCCKMNIPRQDGANRNFSTSWGRSAYICSARQMEQNPLLVFYRNCFGKQSVESALKFSNTYLNKEKLKIKQVSKSNKLKDNNAFNLKYGVVNVLNLSDYVESKSIDFIITDPPYGGLVKYLDLSYLWLLWLKKYDKKYGEIDFFSEITINNKCDLKTYEMRFTNALKECFRVLKDSGKMVITFHNKDIKIWNSFMRSLKNAGFVIEKVIHQYNRRSGESVVANPYGTSGTDFYLRCVKSNKQDISISDDLENKILQTAILAIAERNEPTPYEILFDAILANITTSGYLFSDDCVGDINNTLKKHIGSIFEILDSSNKAGKLWWFKNPQDYIKFYHIPLTQRVELAVLNLLKNKGLVALDEVLGLIYKHFPNGLTPERENIITTLEKYANKSSGKWIYNPQSSHAIQATTHTKYIYNLAQIGKKLGFSIFIGKREQGEIINNEKLSKFSDILGLDFIKDDFIRSRAEMIDLIFLKDKEIKFIFEVENSTSIISALHRGSVLESKIPKFIIIPQDREKELLAMQEPLTLKSIKENNWKYMLYSDIDKMLSSKNPQISDFAKEIGR